MNVPPAVAGAVTIALIVVLGILIFPAWLKTGSGRLAVAIATVLLAALFAAFDGGALDAASIAVATLLALLPLAVALIVRRLQN